MPNIVLILGASGKIGRHSADAFAKAGWTVRLFDRQKDEMTQAAMGADVIVNGLNPPNYHAWDRIIPDITKKVIAAAHASGATVIVPGNVYHFGDQAGVWSARTPAHPVSRKGQIRLEMEQTYRRSGVQTLVLRAGNFIDPDRDDCVMSQIYLRAIGRGKIILPGPADTRQAMCYLPDWARAAVGLAETRQQLALFEDIPFPGHTLTATDIKIGLERILERKLRFSRFPWWAVTALTPFSELAREIKEMRYLWNTDHALCGQRLGHLLPGFTPTDLDRVLRKALPMGML